MNKKIKILAYIIGLGILFFSHTNFAMAFAVSPLRQVISLDAGQKDRVYVEVKNDTSETLKVNLRVTGIKQAPNGQPIFADNSDDAETWVVPEKKMVEILPREMVKVFFEIRVPESAETKLHYLGLMVALNMSNEKEVKIVPEVASYLLIQVAGTVNENIQLVGWNLNKKVFWGEADVTANLTLRNAGSAVLPVFIDTLVSNHDGTIVINKKSTLKNILQGALRTSEIGFSLAEEDTVRSGIYDVNTTVSYGSSEAQKLPQLRFIYISKKTITFFVFSVIVIILGGFSFRKLVRGKKKI